jgi:hypothetical protein
LNKKDLIGLLVIWLQGAIVGYVGEGFSDLFSILAFGIGWLIGAFIFPSILALITRRSKIQTASNMKTIIKYTLILSTVCFVVFLFVPMD